MKTEDGKVKGEKVNMFLFAVGRKMMKAFVSP
jgi:hypothetical protein